jgi:hypothetical protein
MIVGIGLFIVKGSAVEVPPPGAGLNTVMTPVPPVAMSLAGIDALKKGNSPLTKLVGRAIPFHSTTDPLKKPVPLTVRSKAGPPAVTATGLIPVITGIGFVIVRVAGFEIPPPVTKTVMVAVPAVAMSLAGMVALNRVLLTKVVTRSAPFQRIIEKIPSPAYARQRDTIDRF